MSDDQLRTIHARLDQQDATLLAIHTAIVGKPEMGQDGLIPRVKAAEARLDGHDKTMLKGAGVAAGMSLVVTVLKDRLFS